MEREGLRALGGGREVIKSIKLGMQMRTLKNLQPRLNFIKEDTSIAICSSVASGTFWGVEREMQQYFISYLPGMHL